MKKYVIPTLNLIIISLTSAYIEIREGQAYHLIWIIGIGFFYYWFIISNLRKNTNEIKIKSMNKILSILAMVSLGGTAYELITGDRISDEVGDYLVYSVLAVTLLIILVDYYIKPCLIPRLKFWLKHYMG